MTDSGMHGLLDAVIGVTRDLSLPDVLNGILRSARDLTGARHGVLRTEAPRAQTFEVGEREEQPSGMFLDVPIRVRDTVFGNLHLAGRRDGTPFTPRDTEAAAALAASAAIAIENATLVERNRQREQWLSASQDVTSALLARADPDDTLRLIARQAREMAGAGVAALAVPVPEDSTKLLYQVVDGLGGADPFTGRLVPVASTSSGKAFTTGRPVVVNDAGKDILAWGARSGVRLSPRVAALDSTVFAPMIVGERRLGVLVVAKFLTDTPFTPAETQLVQTFAGQAALVLEFARAEDDRERLAVLSDRDRIARDLHDLVVQRLFAIGLGLQGLGRLITDRPSTERIAGLVRDIDRTIMEVRNTIFSLQDNGPGLSGLRSELLRIAHEAAGPLGVEPRIGFDGPLDSVVPDEVRPDLLATLREALSNVAKHAEAGAVIIEVAVDRAGKSLSLQVSDDGVGLPKQLRRRSGLANMENRAARWNGTLAVTDEPSGGTHLHWTVPLGRSRSDAGPGSAGQGQES